MPLEVILRCSTPDTKEIPPFSLAQRRIYVDTHLKEEPTERFRKLLGIPYPHRQSRETVVNTLLMVLLPLHNLVVYPKRTEYFGAKIRNVSAKRLTKKAYTHMYDKELNKFFHRCSNENSCLSKLVYNVCTLVLMICSFKDAKDFALDFVLFIPKASCQSTYPLRHSTIEFSLFQETILQCCSCKKTPNKVCLSFDPIQFSVTFLYPLKTSETFFQRVQKCDTGLK